MRSNTVLRTEAVKTRQAKPRAFLKHSLVGHFITILQAPVD